MRNVDVLSTIREEPMSHPVNSTTAHTVGEVNQLPCSWNDSYNNSDGVGITSLTRSVSDMSSTFIISTLLKVRYHLLRNSFSRWLLSFMFVSASQVTNLIQIWRWGGYSRLLDRSRAYDKVDIMFTYSLIPNSHDSSVDYRYNLYSFLSNNSFWYRLYLRMPILLLGFKNYMIQPNLGETIAIPKYRYMLSDGNVYLQKVFLPEDEKVVPSKFDGHLLKTWIFHASLVNTLDDVKYDVTNTIVDVVKCLSVETYANKKTIHLYEILPLLQHLYDISYAPPQHWNLHIMDDDSFEIIVIKSSDVLPISLP